eukprot:Platyproteum_vivax@DN4173_c0_g1_i1.p1
MDPSAQNKKRKRILVTGGGGFIGSHLVDYLMAQNHEVICADNFFSGTKDNILKWLGNPRFEMIRTDVTFPLIIEVDQIYHLACPASPVHYQANAIKTLKTNVLGTMNMLGLAKRCNARILLASTSEVYGDPEVHPQVEEYVGHVNCVGPRSCYDEGKRCAEALCMDYKRQHNVDVCVSRIFNTYGPRMLFHDGRVVSNFIVQALRKESLTIYGQGEQTRSFCYVGDLVKGLVKLMESNETGPINLGNPTEFSIKELATMVAKETNLETPIEYRDIPQDDPKRRKPDITKAQKLLNWNPKVPLEQGLKDTIADFKARAEKCPEDLYCLHQREAVVSTDSTDSPH